MTERGASLEEVAGVSFSTTHELVRRRSYNGVPLTLKQAHMRGTPQMGRFVCRARARVLLARKTRVLCYNH